MVKHPCRLSAEQCEAIRRLAADIPALWHAAATTPADHQAIVRQLVERVMVTVLDDSVMVRMGLRTRHQPPATVVQRQSDEWTLGELSHLLDMPQSTLVSWLRRGELQARLRSGKTQHRQKPLMNSPFECYGVV